MKSSHSSHCISEWIELLSAPDKERRADATTALIGYGEESVPDLLDILTHSDWRVRYRAAEALGQIGAIPCQHAAIVPSLITLTDDEKDHVRYMAAKGLVQIQDPRAHDVLEKLMSDPHSYTRAIAEKGLALLRS